LINVSWPLGTIVDFWFEFFVDDVGAMSAGPAIVGATAGLFYHKNIVLGSSVLQPSIPLNNI